MPITNLIEQVKQRQSSCVIDCILAENRLHIGIGMQLNGLRLLNVLDNFRSHVIAELIKECQKEGFRAGL